MSSIFLKKDKENLKGHQRINQVNLKEIYLSKTQINLVLTLYHHKNFNLMNNQLLAHYKMEK